MIVSLWLGLREFGRDFDSAAPPHDLADSGSKWCHFRKMTAAILWMFWLHFSIVEMRRPSFLVYGYNLLVSDGSENIKNNIPIMFAKW